MVVPADGDGLGDRYPKYSTAVFPKGWLRKQGAWRVAALFLTCDTASNQKVNGCVEKQASG